ncbi:hypothetical protein LX64_01439 [Chitinophaga skermanii]|uniref:Uncharacterized protein n=1 Tax=Chitinophaga skermanii TaxID=331697 RepID=A0A327QXT3_9BACT|nr:contact-dependent growth inhibition system immunity protein [Chitinophaga skermanii]RAJ08785.1 hypothetical protein LX64_01439 [Chitinophaga skermanii]
MNVDISIEALENNYWQDIDFPTKLVSDVHALRKKKLTDLLPWEIMTAIGQEVGLEYTLPLAIELLKLGIGIEAKYYPGDLLKTVLQTKDDYWLAHKKNWEELMSLMEANILLLPGLDIDKNTLKEIHIQYDKFRILYPLRK